jgi:excisionase family DNA binding protein
MSKSNSPLPPLDPQQRYTVEEAIRYLRSSRASVYKDIAQGKLLSIKEGSRRYIPGSEIARRSRLGVT